LNGWKNNFPHLLNGISDVRQKGIRTPEQLAPTSISFEAEIAIATLKRYKSPIIDQIPA
jgi:hypothetical protein